MDLDARTQAYLRDEAARRLAGQVDGRHYTAFVPEVKAMRRAGDDDAAAGVLLRLIDAVEREAHIPLAGHLGVPPWYFHQLAIIYRKAGMGERAALVMKRFEALNAMASTSGQQRLDHLRGTRRPNQALKRVAFAFGRLFGALFRPR